MTPLVSVVIPCRNEARFIERAIDSALASEYPREGLEVIVADGRSTDATREILTEYEKRDRRLRWIDNPERITPVGLNRAIREARGDVIVRLDGHAEIAR